MLEDLETHAEDANAVLAIVADLRELLLGGSGASDGTIVPCNDLLAHEYEGCGTLMSTPPGPPGPPTHQHDDGTRCMWVRRNGIDRWRQVSPNAGWDLGPCPDIAKGNTND